MGKVEELHKSIVEQFAAAHIREPTGQINFTRFMNSLYDLDEDPIYKDWLVRNDEAADVIAAAGTFSAESASAAVDHHHDENEQLCQSAALSNNDGVSAAATAGSSPSVSTRCVQLNVVDILSTYENRILGDSILKSSAEALENTLTSALSRAVAKVEEENATLREKLTNSAAAALSDYQNRAQDEMALLCHQIVMQDDNNKRAAQAIEWRACKQVLEELLFED